MFWLVLDIILFSITLSLVGAAFFAEDNRDKENLCLGSCATGMSAILILLIHMLPTGFPSNVPVVNTNNVPIQVSYIQYHPWSDDTLGTVALFPGQSKLLHRARILAEIKVNEGID